MVPGFEARLMESSEEEVIEIAFLVRHIIDTCLVAACTDFSPASERDEWVPCRRHKRDERRHHRLDYTEGADAESPHPTECQVRARFQPRTHWSASLPCPVRLEQYGVS